MRQSMLPWLVSWCFKPSQPQRFISGLNETFIKRQLVSWLVTQLVSYCFEPSQPQRITSGLWWWWWWWWWLFPRVRGFWENVRRFIPRQRSFFQVEISSHKLLPLFRPGSVHSGSASWDDCDRVFPDELRVSSFPERFPHSAWTAASSAHSDLVASKVPIWLGVTSHLQFWQNDRGLLRATAATCGRNGHRIRVSTQSWHWRRKFPRRSCRDLNWQSFDHEYGALTNKLSRLPLGVTPISK